MKMDASRYETLRAAVNEYRRQFPMEPGDVPYANDPHRALRWWYFKHALFDLQHDDDHAAFSVMRKKRYVSNVSGFALDDLNDDHIDTALRSIMSEDPTREEEGSDGEDVRVENHGSIVLLRPITGAAEDWIDEHIDADAQWFGGAVAVEPRYVEPILEGIQASGLSVK